MTRDELRAADRQNARTDLGSIERERLRWLIAHARDLGDPTAALERRLERSEQRACGEIVPDVKP